jgi:hypothetical protein
VRSDDDAAAAATPDLDILDAYTEGVEEYLAKHPIGEQGHKIRHALRGWLETPNSKVYAESVGINWTNIPAAWADAVMLHLKRHGIRHVRIDCGWNVLDINGELINADVRAALKAAKKHNIRATLLLNAYEGAPCPEEIIGVTLTRPLRRGDRALYISSDDAKKVALFRTGFDHHPESDDPEEVPPYRAINCMAVAAWDFGGSPETRIDFSRPIRIPGEETPAGWTIPLKRLIAPPFFALKRDGTGRLHSLQYEALHAWLGLYVKRLCAVADALLGRGKYDLEVGNELMFGSAFFVAGSQYIDEDTRVRLGFEWGHHLLDEILQRTCDYAHETYKGSVLVINGFASQNIWRTGGTEINADMTSRHFYVPKIERDGIRYYYPEQTFSNDYDGVNSMWLDIAPGVVAGQFGRDYHSWKRDGSPGPAETLAQTEGGMVTQAANEERLKRGLPAMTVAEHMRLRAKMETRALLFAANKGGVNRDGRGTRYYPYTLREGDQLHFHQIAHPALFEYLQANAGVYPATAALESPMVADTFKATKRLRYWLPLAPRITKKRALAVARIESLETHPRLLITESGPYGPLSALEMLTVLPFQTGDGSFCIALYVQSIDLTQPDLPEEAYRITLDGIFWLPGVSSARLIDVLDTGKSISVSPDTGDIGAFTLKLTDCPKLLILKGV